MTVFIGGVILGLLVGAAAAFAYAASEVQTYRDRWQEALKIIEQAKLTDKPGVLELEPGRPPKATASSSTVIPAALLKPAASKAGDLTQKQLSKMPWHARRDLEIARYRAGMPPRDTLVDMPWIGVKQVEEARMKYKVKL